jgi:CRP/FNR family transcriptional regulator
MAVPGTGVPAEAAFDAAVSRIAFLRALAPADLARLRAHASIRRIARGGAVWTVDESAQEFVFAIDGHARLMRPCENGREVMVDVSRPGELLCASAASACAPYCCTCTALDDGVTVLALPRGDVLGLLEQNAAAAAAFVREATGREMRLGRRIAELASGSVEQRMCALLLRLADQAGTAVEDGHVRIGLKLSRQDLADLCGTTLESAIRVMSRLSRAGTVGTSPAGFLVRDRAALEALARGRSER